MKTSSPKILFTLLGALAFNFLFWQEKLGISALIFDTMVIGAIFLIYPESRNRRGAWFVLAGHLITMIMLIVYNTLLSKIAAVLSLFLFAGFAEYLHRSVIFAGGSVLVQAGLLVAEFTELVAQRRKAATGSTGGKVASVGKKTSTRLRMLFIPIVLLFLFLFLYLGGNKAFANIFTEFFGSFSTLFTEMLNSISWSRILFILLGAYITGSLIIQNRINRLSDRELSLSDRLVRIRGLHPGAGSLAKMVLGRLATGMLALKNKYRIGLISLVMLNGLLLIINITDIFYIWIADDYGKNQSLTELLHEGTGVLILSIVLAMMVVLFFFNGNINFYKKNRSLRIAALAWLIQNIFLVGSVFMRDYYYINHFGLAYKRIGVLFFLAVVLIGIVSVIIKISYQKSSYFLFRVNGNAMAVLLIFSSIINWDVMIAEYNISKIDSIKPDINFLLNLSEKTLPVLRANQQKISEKTSDKVYYFRFIDDDALVSSSGSFSGSKAKGRSFEDILEEKESRYLARQSSLSWLSWNFADAAIERKLQHTGKDQQVGAVIKSSDAPVVNKLTSNR